MRAMRVAGLLAAVLVSAALPAAAEVKDSSASGFTLENSVTVPGDPRSAWNALVDDVGLWWPADHTWWGDARRLSIEPRAGGCFCEKGVGHQQAWHMTVTFVEPGRLLRMTGGLGPLQGMGLHGAMEFRLQPDGDLTRITLWYRVGGYSPDDLSKFAPVVDGVQKQQLEALAAYLSADADADAAAAEADEEES